MLGILIIAALAAAPQSQAADEAPKPDASLTRIRTRLARPERLHVSVERELPEPTFRIEIHQHPYFTEYPFIWTFDSGGVPFGTPGFVRTGTPLVSSGNVLPLFTSLKRALDEHAAKAEVQKAILEFCATHLCVLPR